MNLIPITYRLIYMIVFQRDVDCFKCLAHAGGLCSFNFLKEWAEGTC